MSPFIIAIMFGAGTAGWVYSKMGKRVGYGNQQAVWMVTGGAFFGAAIIAYTVFAFLLPN